MGRRQNASLRTVILVALALIIGGALLNGGLIALYRHKILPHSYLGSANISELTIQDIAAHKPAQIIPGKLTFTHAGNTYSVPSSAVGLAVDVPGSLQQANPVRQWLPTVSLFSSYHYPLRLHFNQPAFQSMTVNVDTRFNKAAVPEHIIFNGSTFVIAPAADGYTVDNAQLASVLSDNLQAGLATVPLPMHTIPAPAATQNLDGELAQLRHYLTIPIQFDYRGKVLRPSSSDIGSWFEPSGQTMSLSAQAAQPYLAALARQLNITIANPSDLADAAVYAVGKYLPRKFTITPAGPATIVRTYCVATKDVGLTVLADLIGKLAATYIDSDGWNNDGQIAFEHVSSGCQYTVWMAASASMTSFGAICDNYYNCQVGTNVVLNYDRWLSATAPWNASNGNLEDYRTLMIDHETGHRLGFLDNPICPAVGKPAPVMMQQSINLKGCTFNIWPLSSERSQLDSMLGLAPPTGAVSE